MPPPPTSTGGTPTAPDTAKTWSPRRPPFGPMKVLLVVLVLIALTPFWVGYGVLGKILTSPARFLSRHSLAILGLFAALVTAELMIIEYRHRDKLAEATGGAGHENRVARLLGTLLAVVGSLMLAQWKLHSLIMAVVQRSDDTESAVSLLVDCIAPLLILLAMLESVYKWKHWELVTGLSLYLFGVVYLATPVIIALAHIKFWVPARYSELERLEREIIGKNVNVPFHLLKVAGLGTVHVPYSGKHVDEPRKTLVLIHGFAAGNALWACNFEFLSKYYDVYAIEWVGTGRSDRPDFASYEQADADKVFVDGIERWRHEMKLERFCLIGHSMGAMLASSYAVQHADVVEHLVLVSPAGVGLLPPLRPLPLGLKFFRYLWSLRLTPMSLARYAGPFGPALLRFIAKTRVAFMPATSCIRRGDIPLEALAAYWYHNWALKASGEIAMYTHLHPGVFAKRPLREMLTPATIKVPITFLYGGGPDWMESRHGEELAKQFDGHQRVEVLKVPLAGHQVFMDNVDEFNMMVHQALATNNSK